MDIAPLAILRPLLLAQTEELITRGEQNRTRVVEIIERKIAAGQLVDGAGELLQVIEERLARLHARRQRLFP
jgi:hypothetical protein